MLARLTDPADASTLDRGLVLWFPAPASATGEDVAELHLHGGRAVLAAVERALARITGLRLAQAGEFTRRAFANGRIDLAEAEGLADLLAAETELQRRTALAMASGRLSRAAEHWRRQLLDLSAAVESALDFSDEEDVAHISAGLSSGCATLAAELEGWLGRPRAEPLREGFRIVLAGPPNAGKSTLLNALTESEASITSPHPGTTRDLIVRAVAIEGVPLMFIDTAGLHGASSDPIEAIGIERARAALGEADVVLWLGPETAAPPARCVWQVHAKADLGRYADNSATGYQVSAITGEGIAYLRSELVQLARAALPSPGEVALSKRQTALLEACRSAVASASVQLNPLLAAEDLRVARTALDRLLGRLGTEDMLDTLFARFCIGK